MKEECQICGKEITEDNSTSASNICQECAGAGYEILTHFFG